MRAKLDSLVYGILGGVLVAVSGPLLLWAAQTYVLPTGTTGQRTEMLTNAPNRDEALRSTFSGPNAPTSPAPTEGQLWYETDTDIPHVYNGVSWLDYVLPDAPQTLTNKTLPAPAISSPTLSGTATGTYTLGGTPTIGTNLTFTDNLYDIGASGATRPRHAYFAGGIATGAGTSPIKTKILNIGDWNMDATALVSIAHGLTLANIRRVTALIRADDDLSYTIFPVAQSVASSNEYINVGSTSVNLTRGASGSFDSIDYDATSYDRGWIMIDYI